MRFLGIDYGEKRIGLSWGEDLGLATPLPAAVKPSLKERLAEIGETIRERRIDEIVIGYPYNMDGSEGFKAKEVDRFIERLESRFGLPVHRVDERLTSVEAKSRLLETGSRMRPADRKSGRLDSLAATLILQDYLDQRFPPPLTEFHDEEED